jgi:hypothetical protein
MLPDIGLSKSLIKLDNENDSKKKRNKSQFEDEYSTQSQISFYLLPRFTTVRPKPSSYFHDHLFLQKQKPFETNDLICRFQELKMTKTKR